MSSPNRDPSGYYRMLEVSPDAPRHEIRLAYERVLAVAHANRMAFVAEMAATAYKSLSDEASRRSYDSGYNPTSDENQTIRHQPLSPFDSKHNDIQPQQNSTPPARQFRGSVGGINEKYYKPKSWWEKLLD